MSHEKSCCKADAHNPALAGAIVMAVLYVLCVAASVWWTDGFLNLMNTMTHAIDLKKAAPGSELTVGSFFLGLVQSVVYTYVVVYAFVWLLNKLRTPKIEASHHESKSCCS